MRILEIEEVIDLLRTEIARAGSQTAWCRKARIDRTALNKVLNGHRPPTDGIIAALNLRVVFTADDSKRNGRRDPP